MMNPFFHTGGPVETVAFCAGQNVSRQRFLCDLAGAVRHLLPFSGGIGLLLTEDAYWSAVGLLAMAQAGVDVILPPNAQPASIQALAGQFAIVVCDSEIAATDSGLTPKIVLDATLASALPGNVMCDPSARVSFFTSGSSAARKQCLKTMAHLFAEAQAIEHLLGHRAPAACAVFGTVSHQHAYGFAFRMLWPLLSGRQIVGRMHRFIESLFHDLHRPAVVVSSPAHLSRLEGIRPLPEAKMPSVLLSAGGHLRDDAAAAAMRIFGVPVTDIYGSTEAGAMAFRIRGGADDMWEALPGTTISPSATGELRAQAAHIPPEGENNADRLKLRSDGKFMLTGRSDRVVKVEGKRISLSEIERLLGEMAEVESAFIVSFTEGEGLGAIIIPTQNGWNAVKHMGQFRFGRQLRAHLARWIDPAGLPRRWRFLKELPLGDMGKTNRAELARYFEADSP